MIQEQSPRTVFLADDHEVVRRGLRFVLEREEGYKVVGEAGNGRETVEQVVRLCPDLVVMDIFMPLMDGVEAAKEIHRVLPDSRILVFSVSDSRRNVVDLIRSGMIHGYVLKKASFLDILSAIREVMDGKTVFPQGFLQDKDQRETDSDEKGLRSLTHREQEVLKLIAAGRKNREIGEMLFISVRTVEKHRLNIMHKMGFRSVQQLARYAEAHGLIQEGSGLPRRFL